ncbi:hypothetical protein [Massilia sp. CCM 8734]|uniref:hypothetical protein n=1 Tax=Massilia sp. CCM 8734 TaxID=2609283 RepID=UPI001424A2FE|nr:hypothetical protein [Massilia sp. CCM 8734]NHZ96473.1 hypothetical protein [Massilia sp. CCM 8734]
MGIEMQSLRRPCALLLAAGLLAGVPARAATLDAQHIRPSGLTLQQARKVLSVVLEHQKFQMKRKDAHLFVEGPDKDAPDAHGYYSLQLYHNPPKAAMLYTLGHFSVNMLTAEVWDFMRCERTSFPALSTIQQRVSARTGQRAPDEQKVRDELCLN